MASERLMERVGALEAQQAALTRELEIMTRLTAGRHFHMNLLRERGVQFGRTHEERLAFAVGLNAEIDALVPLQMSRVALSRDDGDRYPTVLVWIETRDVHIPLLLNDALENLDVLWNSAQTLKYFAPWRTAREKRIDSIPIESYDTFVSTKRSDPGDGSGSGSGSGWTVIHHPPAETDQKKCAE